MISDLEYITDGKRHLICRPYSIQNMHHMAQALGIKRCWFHSKPGRSHYDIPVLQVDRVQRVCTVVTSRELIGIMEAAPVPQQPEFNLLLPPLPPHFDGELFNRNHPKELVMDHDNAGNQIFTAYHK